MGTLSGIGSQAGGLGEFLRYQDKLKQQEFQDKVEQSYLNLQQDESATRRKLLQERLNQSHLGTAITWKTPDGQLHSGYASLDPSGQLVTHELPGILQQRTGAGMPMSVDDAKQRIAEMKGYDDWDSMPEEEKQSPEATELLKAFEKVVPKTGQSVYDKKMAYVDAGLKDGSISPEEGKLMKQSIVAPGTIIKRSDGQQGTYVWTPNGMVFVQVPTSRTTTPQLPSGVHATPAAGGAAPTTPQTPSAKLAARKGKTGSAAPAASQNVAGVPSGPGVKVYPGLIRETPEQIKGRKDAMTAATKVRDALAKLHRMRNIAQIATLARGSRGLASQVLFFDTANSLITSSRQSITAADRLAQAGSLGDRLSRFYEKASKGNLTKGDATEMLQIVTDVVQAQMDDARDQWTAYNQGIALPQWLAGNASHENISTEVPKLKR